MRTVTAVLLVAAFFAATSTYLAIAAEAPTREEYVGQLERMCKPGVKATQRAMRGVRDDIRAERDGIAARKFRRGTAIFATTIGDIAGVSRPAADAVRLRKWFSYLNRQEEYLREITSHLRAGQTIKAQRSTARFIHNGNLANNVVLAFGFNYCSFRFSRFG